MLPVLTRQYPIRAPLRLVHRPHRPYAVDAVRGYKPLIAHTCMLLPSSTLSAAQAISFCGTSPSAVIVTVWPSGGSEIDSVVGYLEQTCGASILHASPVQLKSPLAQLLSVMALYDGEEWLESNRWYMEQPLPTGPPNGPYAGAKWKHNLCYKGELAPHAIVADVSAASSSVWAGKYALRASLSHASGNPGNSCIHLTDPQDSSVLAAYASGARRRAFGSDCDASYAYACARALLHPASVAFLNSDEAAALQLGEAPFREAWQRYTAWLHEPPSADAEREGFVAAPTFV